MVFNSHIISAPAFSDGFDSDFSYQALTNALKASMVFSHVGEVTHIWEEGPELHREQPCKLASSAALCTTGWKQLAWQYLLCWYE